MRTYVVLDLETTGLDPAKEQITQICAIKYTEDGKQVGRFDTYVQLEDGRKPSPYSPHVTEELCSTGMEEREAIRGLDYFMDGSALVIQYAPFDLSFINAKHPQTNHIERYYDFFCTRTLSKIHSPSESPSLGPTAKRLGIIHPKQHDAVYDCLVTWKVFSFLKSNVPYPKSKGFDHWKNTVIDFKDRPLKYRPLGSKVLLEENGWGF